MSDPSSSSPVSTLRVNSEVVEAVDLWRGTWQELVEKEAALTPAEFRTYLEQRATERINDHIAEVLLHQQAKLRDPVADEKALDRFVDEQIRKIVTADFEGIQRRYEKRLEIQGTTLDEVRQRIQRELLIARYLETELKPLVAEPTRAELLEVYEQNIDGLRRPARRRMALVDVRVQDRLPKDVNQPSRAELELARAEARKRIEAAQDELRRGRDFGDVARRYSDGLAAAEGGDWGWVTKEGVRPRFVPALDALETLSSGQISVIIEVDDGFFLVRCTELEPAYEPDFQSVQPDLRERYIRIKYNRLIADRVRDLRQKARFDPSDLSRFHAAVVESGLTLHNAAPASSP